MVSQMKAMEAENKRLKRMYAPFIDCFAINCRAVEKSLQNDLLKEALGKKA